MFLKSGFMTRHQKEVYESAQVDYPGVNLYWLPGLWFCHELREAQKKGKISSHDGTRLITAVGLYLIIYFLFICI